MAAEPVKFDLVTLDATFAQFNAVSRSAQQAAERLTDLMRDLTTDQCDSVRDGHRCVNSASHDGVHLAYDTDGIDPSNYWMTYPPQSDESKDV